MCTVVHHIEAVVVLRCWSRYAHDAHKQQIEFARLEKVHQKCVVLYAEAVRLGARQIELFGNKWAGQSDRKRIEWGKGTLSTHQLVKSASTIIYGL